ncbi:hypothetical protein M758_4G062300 [Ceratodon purpureus]|uniref:F-box domain-containing protein n=1 Tax=Ceratodon purpureus TaxID=3225 RepID=A0A8T0I601_CERPU|nr:hypothetical protein KC19_4G056800 [Ceratodon purpureus]KAG0618415.1 hypothetical protein M758_4G062300 [Ceratodon purpureus]
MADFVAYNDMMEVSSSAGDRRSEPGLIPSLPDDVFLNCLVRVPLQWHANLQKVSRSLRSLVQSAEYYEQRRAEGTSSSFICMLQPLPRSATDFDTVFGITLLDLQTMAWERLPAVRGLPGGLPTFAKLVAVKGELVVLGGWWQHTWEPSRAVLVFNFSSQTWRRGADMPSARSFFACGALGGRVVVAGGHDGDKKALASAEAYDVATNSWSNLRSMKQERDEPTGVAMADGRFVVVSGYGSESQGVFAKSGEVYDSATDSWSFVDDMWTWGAADAGVANPSSLAVMAGEIYGVHGKEVVVYSHQRNAWTVVETVPEECEKGEITSSSITAVGNSLVITGLVKKNEIAALRTLRLTPAHGSRKAQWQTITCNDQFLNLAQTTCAFRL